jgi:UDP-perosamine 4-acetyltransferase
MIHLVGLGAGGHAKVLLEALTGRSNLFMKGFLERPDSPSERLGYPVLGTDDLLPQLRSQGITHFFIGLGSIGPLEHRLRLFEQGKAAGLLPLTIVHPRAIVSADAVLGEGTALLAGSIINPGVRLGENTVVNTGAIVEHDGEIGDQAMVSPGACLLGGVRVGPSAFIGAGAIVLQGLKIGAGALVGAGAVVTKDVPPGGRVKGIPARPY